MANIDLKYKYELSKKLLTIYKNDKVLCEVKDIPNINVAKFVFKDMFSDIECYVDCYAQGETNYDKFDWMVEGALEMDDIGEIAK